MILALIGCSGKAVAQEVAEGEPDQSILEIDGEVFRFEGIPQSEVDSWGPETRQRLSRGRRRGKLITSSYRQAVRLGLDGKIQLSLTPDQRYIGVLPLITFLLHPGVENDLLLTREQSNSLETSRKKMESEYQRFETAKRKHLDNPEIEPALSRLEALNIEIRNNVAANLLPQQVDRLRQLIARKQVREFGLPALVLFGKCGIETSEQQKNELMHRLKAGINELRQKSAQLKREVVQELLSVLQPGQRKKLSERYDLEKYQPPIGVLWARLKWVDQKIPAPFIADYAELVALGRANEYQLDEFGQLVAPDFSDAPIVLRGNVAMGLNQILGGRNVPANLLMNSVADLELTDDQVAESRRLFREIMLALNNLSSSIAAVKDESEAELARRRKAEREDAFRSIIRQHYQLLQIDQQKKLKDILATIELNRIGMLNLLLNTSWKEELKVSDQQATRLKNKAKNLRIRLSEESAEAEQVFLRSTVWGVLDRDQAKQLEAALGAPVEKLVSNLDLLVELSEPSTIEDHLSHMKLDLRKSFQSAFGNE